MNYKISDGTLLIAPFVVIFFLPGVGVLIGLVCFLLWIGDKVADAQVKQAMKPDSSSKIVLHVPEVISPPASAPSDEESSAIIEAALAETERQMAFVICSDPAFRNRYFTTVFTRLCERQGVKVNKVNWKV